MNTKAQTERRLKTTSGTKTTQEQGIGYFGGLLTSFAAWNIDTWFAMIGVAMGVITFMTGQYYSYKRRKDEEEQTLRDKTLFDLEVKIKEAELLGFHRRKRDELKETPT
jgi:hypothetical protein